MHPSSCQLPKFSAVLLLLSDLSKVCPESPHTNTHVTKIFSLCIIVCNRMSVKSKFTLEPWARSEDWHSSVWRHGSSTSSYISGPVPPRSPQDQKGIIFEYLTNPSSRPIPYIYNMYVVQHFNDYVDESNVNFLNQLPYFEE